MKSAIKKLFFDFRDFFRYREACALFLVLTDKNEVFDYFYVTGSRARRNNETDYAFREFVSFHLEHTRKDCYIPPYRILRYDFLDVSLLPYFPKGEITEMYMKQQLIPWLLHEVFVPMKELDFRQLCFAVQFDVYSLDAVCDSIGLERSEVQSPKGGRYIVNRILEKDLSQNRSYNFYCEMLALQDERKLLCHALPQL